MVYQGYCSLLCGAAIKFSYANQMIHLFGCKSSNSLVEIMTGKISNNIVLPKRVQVVDFLSILIYIRGGFVTTNIHFLFFFQSTNTRENCWPPSPMKIIHDYTNSKPKKLGLNTFLNLQTLRNKKIIEKTFDLSYSIS